MMGCSPGQQIETQALHPLPEIPGIRMHAVAQILGAFEQLQNLQRRRRHRRRDAVGKEIGPRALAQPADDLLAGRDVSAARAAERLAESARQDVHAVHHALELMSAAAASAR